MRRLTIGVTACTEIMGLLVAMAWADGVLEPEEKDGIRDAAKTLNLNQELRNRLESFMEEAVPISSVDFESLNPRDREFAYVACAWMARVDSGVDDSERDLLEKIGMLLEIPSGRRNQLDELAFDLDAPSEGWSQGIVTLFRAIVKRVEEEDVDVIFA